MLVAVFAVIGVTLALGGVATAAESGGIINWSQVGGDGHSTVINHNVYIIDETGSRFPVTAVTGEWQVRTGVPVFYRVYDTFNWDCSAVHCAYIEERNMGLTGWRVRVTGQTLNGLAGDREAAVVTINTAYSWTNETSDFNKSGACQAVGKGVGLDYTRSAAATDSCMSSAMVRTIGNPVDDSWMKQVGR